MTVLFYSAGSPYARIIRMAVIECGLEGTVAQRETTLRDPAAPLLPFSPVGRVPALVLADGTVLTETLLILPVVQRLAPDAPLLPRTDGELAELGQVMGLMDGVAVWNRELRRVPSERAPGVLALEETRADSIADALEAAVAQGGYRGAALAPRLALAALLGYAERRHTAWRWRAQRPCLAAWFTEAAQRPAFLATLPPPSGI